MTPDTKYANALRSTGWSLREWTRRSGISINTLRKLSASPNPRPQRRTIEGLQAALRQSASEFAALADTLDAP